MKDEEYYDLLRQELRNNKIYLVDGNVSNPRLDARVSPEWIINKIKRIQKEKARVAELRKPQASELPSDSGKSQIVCPICGGIFSRDRDHTCICHKREISQI